MVYVEKGFENLIEHVSRNRQPLRLVAREDRLATEESDLSLMFVTGGKQGTRRRGSEATRGFPAVSPLDAEPAVTRQREDERGRASLNELDNQTAVHKRETYMLYSKPETSP
jgi:hypothetical protein